MSGLLATCGRQQRLRIAVTQAERRGDTRQCREAGQEPPLRRYGRILRLLDDAHVDIYTGRDRSSVFRMCAVTASESRLPLVYHYQAAAHARSRCVSTSPSRRGTSDMAECPTCQSAPASGLRSPQSSLTNCRQIPSMTSQHEFGLYSRRRRCSFWRPLLPPTSCQA